MENFYTAYTKTIDGVTFNFVKHFQTFPEFKNVPPLLQNYGMHTDFHKACKIAMINDKTVQQQLLDTVIKTTGNAEVTNINSSKNYIYNYRRRQMNLRAIGNWMVVRRLLHFKEKIAYNYFRLNG